MTLVECHLLAAIGISQFLGSSYYTGRYTGTLRSAQLNNVDQSGEMAFSQVLSHSWEVQSQDLNPNPLGSKAQACFTFKCKIDF